MTLSETLLPKLSEWRPAGLGRHSWAEALPAAGWAVRLAADKTDSLSCLVWELTLARTGDAPAGLTPAGWAAGVAARVGGLMEPLAVHEVDEARGEAVLRSTAPAQTGGAVAYYELRLLADGRAALARYTATRGHSGREQVAFALTHEVIAKFAADLAA